MQLDPFMPTTCWIAPDIPRAKYNLGETTCPELPIWSEWLSHPESTTGLDEASCAPINSDSSFAIGIFSSLPIPRPIETIKSADDRSISPSESLNFGSLIILLGIRLLIIYFMF